MDDEPQAIPRYAYSIFILILEIDNIILSYLNYRNADMPAGKRCLTFFKIYYKNFILVLTPIILSPIIFMNNMKPVSLVFVIFVSISMRLFTISRIIFRLTTACM